jgi:hypothetical protein
MELFKIWTTISSYNMVNRCITVNSLCFCYEEHYEEHFLSIPHQHEITCQCLLPGGPAPQTPRGSLRSGLRMITCELFDMYSIIALENSRPSCVWKLFVAIKLTEHHVSLDHQVDWASPFLRQH